MEQAPRKRKANEIIFNAPSSSSSSSSHTPRQWGAIETFPELQNIIEELLFDYRKATEARDKAKVSLENISKFVRDKTVPKSLFPNVQIHLPNGINRNDEFETICRSFAEKTRDLIEEARKEHLDKVTAHLNELKTEDEAKINSLILERVKKSEALHKMALQVSLAKLSKIFKDHRLQIDFETEQITLKAKKEAERKAKDEMEIEQRDAETDVRDKLADVLDKKLGPLTARLDRMERVLKTQDKPKNAQGQSQKKGTGKKKPASNQRRTPAHAPKSHDSKSKKSTQSPPKAKGKQ